MATSFMKTIGLSDNRVVKKIDRKQIPSREHSDHQVVFESEADLSQLRKSSVQEICTEPLVVNKSHAFLVSTFPVH